MKILVAALFYFAMVVNSFASERTDPCLVSKAEFIQSDSVVINANLKSKIIQYKKKWADLCSGEKKVALSDLFGDAQKLAETLANEVFRYEKINMNDRQVKYMVSLSKFIPGIVGRCCEGTAIEANITEFGKRKNLGTDEDQQFFQTYLEINPTEPWPAWVEFTWDYGGCNRFGSYDWVKSLQRIEAFQARSKHTVYKKAFDEYEKSMLTMAFYISGKESAATIGSDYPRSICTCGKKSDVLRDLKKVRTFMKTSVRYGGYINAIDLLIDKIAKRQIEINSQEEAHCSGG